MTTYRDRAEAGRVLADRLGDLAGRPDVIVLGLVRGGVPVARVIAERLGAPLDVLVVRKLGVPWAPEVAYGALGPGGVQVLNEMVAGRIGEDERAGRWWWEQESKKECGLHVHRPEEDAAPGQEPAAFEEPARAATSREYRRELV